MKYTRVSFNESFQDWAKANNVACNCGAKYPHSFEGHKASCQVAEAASHWREAGSRLYASLPKPTPTETAS